MGRAYVASAHEAELITALGGKPVSFCMSLVAQAKMNAIIQTHFILGILRANGKRTGVSTIQRKYTGVSI